MFSSYLNIALILTAFAYLTGCGAKTSSSVANSILERNWSQGQLSPEPRTYCATTIAHSDPIIISGTASYEYRPVSIELEEEGLLEVSDETKPIRHAQFDVTDVSGNILQCGETDGAGNFTFTVPNNKKALSLQIYSRSNNSFNKANVYIAPETNELHKLQYFFTANKNKNNILLIAEGEKTVLGGAFNILDQIHNSFDKLRANTTTGLGLNPLLIPPADIYWEAGFSPSIYINESFDISFYLRGDNKIFILGGVDGDTDFTDTDHYDNSIILHEYFHFLESSVSRTNTPGGEHNGNQLLDPRLAWSEGAAQFYQAFVTGIPAVLDTYGNTDGNTGFLFSHSVENANTDIPLNDGEGEFREFAVARFLWDLHDDEEGEIAFEEFDQISGFFPQIWSAFSDTLNNFSFLNERSIPISLSTLTNILDLEGEIFDSEQWYRILTSESIANTTTYVDTENGDVTFGRDFSYYREFFGRNLEPGSASFGHEFAEPYFFPESNPLANYPVGGLHYYSVIIPIGGSITSTFNINKINTTNGNLQLYVFSPNESFTTSNINQGPIFDSESFILTPGAHIIVVALSEMGSRVDTSDLSSLEYEFTNLQEGGL